MSCHDLLMMRARPTNRRVLRLSLLATSALLTAAASAQEVALEEIVVTARKREESVLEVPISVNAFSAEDLSRAGAYDTRDIAAMSSGLTFQVNQSASSFVGRSSGGVAFRGAQLGSGISARDNTGSLFIDGVFVSSGLSSVNTVDVERVEVLKGPQNAYFGRNTFSGAVNFITRNPGDEFKGRIEASGSTRESSDFNLSLEGPLVQEKLAGRLVASLHKKGAMYTAKDGGELGKQSTQTLVGTLYATPSDNLWVRLRGQYQEDDDGPDTSVFIRGTRFGSLCPGQTFNGRNAQGQPVKFALSRPYFCGEIPSLNDLGGPTYVSNTTTLRPGVLQRINQPDLFYNMLVKNSFNNPLLASAPGIDHMGYRRDAIRLTGQSEYEFENGVTMAFNASMEKSDAVSANDPDRSDEENTFAFVPIRVRSQSYEFRVTSPQDQPLRWLAGGSYFRNQQQSQQLAYQIGQAFGAPLPTNGIANPILIDKARVPGAFGSVEYEFGDFTAAGEVRYQEDTSIIAGATSSIKVKVKDWLPRVILRYQPIEDTNLYVSWAKAVMPGNPNSAYIAATPSQKAEIQALFPDATDVAPIPEMTSYEAGIKQRLFEGRLQYSLSAYYMKWRNINVNVSVPVSTTPFFLSVVRANDANLKGIEFEGEALITDHLSTSVVLNYKHDKLTRFQNAVLGTLTSGTTEFAGNKPPRVPSETASFSSTYTNVLTGDWNWFARGDVNYTGKQYESEANIGYLSSFTKVHARIGVENDSIRVELYGRNIFDSLAWESGLRSTSLAEPGALLLVPYPTATSPLTTVQGVIVTPPDRREFGIKATVDF